LQPPVSSPQAPYFTSSAEQHIEKQHQHHPCEQRKRGEVTVLAAVCLGNDFVTDDEDHRTCGHAKNDGHDWLGKPNGRGTDEAAERLDESREGGDPERYRLAIADRDQRDRDSEPFRDVL